MIKNDDRMPDSCGLLAFWSVLKTNDFEPSAYFFMLFI